MQWALETTDLETGDDVIGEQVRRCVILRSLSVHSVPADPDWGGGHNRMNLFLLT